MVAHTKLLEISCRGSYFVACKQIRLTPACITATLLISLNTSLPPSSLVLTSSRWSDVLGPQVENLFILSKEGSY